MEQIIPFKKDIIFKTKIDEVTSISLEHTLKLENDETVSGEFIISGTYKMSEVSADEEFIYKLPFDIILDHCYEPSDLTIDIDDFYYEIIDNEILRVNIEVFIGGEVKEEESIMERDVPIEVVAKEEIIKEPIKKTEVVVPVSEVIEQKDVVDRPVASTELFQEAMESKEEKFVSYHVHIVRNDETLETIIAKYNVSLEQLEQYNDLSNIILGSKLIIPTNNDLN